MSDNQKLDVSKHLASDDLNIPYMSLLILNKQERLRYIGFDDTLFLILGIPVLALFVPIAFFDYGVDIFKGQNFLMNYIESMIHVMVYWVGFRTFVIYVRKKYEGFGHTRKRIMYEFIFILFYGGIMSTVLKYLLKDYCGFPADVAPYKGFIATYFSSIFVLSIYEGLYLYHQNKENILKQEQFKRAHIQSQLQGLRDQVNPHFLFNSLNTLTNIIHEDKTLATSFLKNMSDVYRYILEKRDEQLIPLKDEIQFIESYVFLQKERFKNNLEVTIEVSDYFLEKCVVPLSLQILFENAIKHNIISGKYPLQINVFVDSDKKLVVRNNLQIKSQSMPSTGVGLKNIISRYAFFTNQSVDVVETENEFKVAIPLIESPEMKSE